MVAFARGCRVTETEFDVGQADLSDLEIRSSGKDSFYYFFDVNTNRLITDFVLEDLKQVATLCQVTLIKKDGRYTPRLRFWKKDKTKLGRVILEYNVPDGGVNKIIKASVDTDKAHVNLWKLINFLQSLAEVDLPGNTFRVVNTSSVDLAKTLEGRDKKTILEAVRIAIGGGLTEEDVLLMSNRKAKLEIFEKLLNDEWYFQRQRECLGVSGKNVGPEAVWQQFFEANTWIFGYGLKLVACSPLDDQKLERITTGANIFAGAGKRSDAVMRSKGYIGSLLFCEIKTHDTPLLAPRAYREPDVYRVSDELSGGISQVQKTVDKALRQISGDLLKAFNLPDGTPTGIQVSTVRPRQALVVGNLNQFSVNGGINAEKTASFELYRNSMQDVEVLTFDELYERACFIVRDS